MEPKVKHFARFFCLNGPDVVIEIGDQPVETLPSTHPLYGDHWTNAWAFQYEDILTLWHVHQGKSVELRSNPTWVSELHIIKAEHVTPEELFQSHRDIYAQTPPRDLGNYLKLPTGELKLIAGGVVLLPAIPEKVAERRSLESVPDYKRPIGELDFSIRTGNCLLRGEVHTVGELLNRSALDLMGIRNFGRKSLAEVFSKLEEFRYGRIDFDWSDTTDEAIGQMTLRERLKPL